MSDSEEVRYECDVAIVGAGVSGALLAHNLAKKGYRVVVLEAGRELRHPEDQVERFYGEDTKTPSAPWPASEYANRPKVTEMGTQAAIDGSPYLQQTGYIPFNSNYERIGGGTGNHWLGTALRHVPDDFNLKTAFGDKSTAIGPDGRPLMKYARDWPIKYDELEEWYTQAEYEVGVSGNDKEMNGPDGKGYHGAKRSKPYPMPEIAPTYLDQKLKERVENMAPVPIYKGSGKTKKLDVLNTPQARNSIDRDGRYRCLGNTSCIPICPIQAKWDPTVSLTRAQQVEGTPAKVFYKHVAHRIEIGNDGKTVSKIHFKDYSEADQGTIKDGIVTAQRYVLCAHAVETAKLLLNSPWKEGTTVANSSGQVGRNLMDHIICIRWGAANIPVYPFRGPLSTSGIGDFRDGEERTEQASFRIENGNVGWNWGGGAPQKTVTEITELIGGDDGYGENLKTAVRNNIQHQMSFQGEPEALPLPGSRVLLSGETDPLGIPRPILHYEVSEYTKRAFIHVGEVMEKVLEAMGADRNEIRATVVGKKAAAKFGELGDRLKRPIMLSASDKSELDCRKIPVSLTAELMLTADVVIIPEQTTGLDGRPEYKDWVIEDQGADKVYMIVPDKPESEVYDPDKDYGYNIHEAKVHEYGGAGHIVGTYRMGSEAGDSVADGDCRSHDHDNLFLQGSGLFPAIATANPTLTIMALALRAADKIASEIEPRATA